MENKGTMIVSLDFELFWGMHDVSNFEEYFNSYKNNVSGVWEAIPKMLELFKKYSVHATWGTVGLAFASPINDVNKYIPDKELWPSYDNSFQNPYPKIKKIDINSKYYYASELIDLITKYEGQEIGSHTFSHYYCKEKGQTVEQFDADIFAAKKIAESKGISLKSIILPRNQCETDHISVLFQHGFTSYRDEENDWIHKKIKNRKIMRGLRLIDVYLPITGQGGYIPRKENGIWNLMGSRMYKPFFKPLFFLEGLKIHRIKKQMLHAAKNGLTFHLWWHPHNIGVMTDFHIKQLDEVFSYYEKLKEKYGMMSLNMSEVVDVLENK